MPVKITEKHVTKSIRDLLRTLGVFHWKQFQTLGSPLGIADILGIYQGKMLAIEVKAPHGKPSPHQAAFLEMVRKQGGIAILAYSVEDVIQGLGVEDRFLNIGRPMKLNEIPGVKRNRLVGENISDGATDIGRKDDTKKDIRIRQICSTFTACSGIILSHYPPPQPSREGSRRAGFYKRGDLS